MGGLFRAGFDGDHQASMIRSNGPPKKYPGELRNDPRPARRRATPEEAVAAAVVSAADFVSGGQVSTVDSVRARGRVVAATGSASPAVEPERSWVASGGLVGGSVGAVRSTGEPSAEHGGQRRCRLRQLK